MKWATRLAWKASVLLALMIMGGGIFSCSSAPSPKAAVGTSAATTTSVPPATPGPAASTTRGGDAGPAAPEYAATPPAATSSPAPGTSASTKETKSAGSMDSGSGGPVPASRSAAPVSVPTQSGLKAGYSDDNEQFNLFVSFLDQYHEVPHVPLDIQERIVLKIQDSEGKALSNALVSVRSSNGGPELARGLSYADGSFVLYPLEYQDMKAKAYQVDVSWQDSRISMPVDRFGPRTLTAALKTQRSVATPLPVDLLFILDTTGSMGEEIERLRSTIEIIDANLTALKPVPALRFGMVLYKDKYDEYVTKDIPFTSDLAAFQRELDEVSADGGGDDPEDLQSALKDAVSGMNWNRTGIRLGFIVTDASAHLDYGQTYTYATAVREAKARGIKLYSIGAGGLPIEGEYVLRQIAQYTQGKYIFLTYGETGESSGGAEGSVSHHTGSNFTADKLEAVIIRFVKEEISRQSDRPLQYDESYISAQRVPDETREATLGKLFEAALQDLSDYSTLKLGQQTRCAILPISTAAPSPAPPAGDNAQDAKELATQSEYFGSQLTLAASRTRLFTLVERKDLQSVLHELELQLSGLSDDSAAAKVGKLLGAEVLVTGTLYRAGDQYELFLKLIRVETSEVLAATKAKLALNLGL